MTSAEQQGRSNAESYHTQPLLVDAHAKWIGPVTPTASEREPKGLARPCASLVAGPPYAYRRVGSVNGAVLPYRPRSRLPYDGRWFPPFYPMRVKLAIRKENGWT
jgi:hypothetical protein